MSPQDFDRCIKEKGRVRTISLGKNKYMHVCWDKKGKSHSGEVKERKKQ